MSSASNTARTLRAALCLSLTLAMHGGLIWCWHQRSGQPTPATTLSERVLQVWLGDAGTRDTSRSEHTHAELEAIDPDPPLGDASLARASQPDTGGESASPPQQISNEGSYLPASQLDQRPQPQSDLRLPFPEDETLPRGTRVCAVLVLYVSEQGKVDKIEFAQSALPPAFARVAVESFARLRLRLGIKNGLPRRAMMKIEVEFEAPDPAQRSSAAVLQSSRSWQEH